MEAMGHRELAKINLGSTTTRILFTRHFPHAQVFDAGQPSITTINIDGDDSFIERITPLPAGVSVVDYNHDQTLLAMGFRDGHVKVIDTTDPESEPIQFDDLDSAVTDICWNVGGDFLAACDATGDCVVWQWYERQVRGRGESALNQPGKRLLAWSYDGKEIAWTTGAQVRVLNMDTEQERTVAKDDWILNPCWSHEGKLLAYIGPENSVVVLNPETGARHQFTGHQLFVESLAWHPNQHYLLSASADGTIRIWDADTKKPVRQLLGHDANVYSAAWSRDGKKVVSGGLPEDSLRVWDLSKLGKVAFDRELQDHPAIAWYPEGAKLVVAEKGDVVIQTEDGETQWLRNQQERPPEIIALDVHPSGKQIACVSGSGRIWTMDAETMDAGAGREQEVYDEGDAANQFPEITSKGVAWSPSGRYLAGVGAGGKLRIWDIAKGGDVSKHFKVSGKVLAVAWAPSQDKTSAILACVGTGKDVVIFDVGRREKVSAFTQHGWKTALAWSSDADRIAIGDRRKLRVWSIRRNSFVANCDGPSAMIWDLSWNDTQSRSRH